MQLLGSMTFKNRKSIRTDSVDHKQSETEKVQQVVFVNY